MGTGDWIFSVLGTLLIVALIVVAIMWLASELGGRGSQVGQAPRSAREILDERLAKGEISTEQYEQLREKLEARSTSASAPGSRESTPPSGVAS